jgi:hypothetical protein
MIHAYFDGVCVHTLITKGNQQIHDVMIVLGMDICNYVAYLSIYFILFSYSPLPSPPLVRQL